MSTPLRDAAARTLRGLAMTPSETAIGRISMEVEADGRVETVIVTLRDGRLQCVSSDGARDGPHVIAALRLIAGQDGVEPSLRPAAGSRSGSESEVALEVELAEALGDLITAVTRVGTSGALHAPSVDAAVERVLEVAPTPTPAGLSRFIGRVRRGFQTADTFGLARVLDGARRLVDALGSEAGADDGRATIEAWIGAHAPNPSRLESVYDRTMVEVGREWLTGTERASLERRFLVDVRTGATYREDRARHAVASLGACPRELHVGLAELEPGPSPRRIRILQYEVRPQVREETWTRLGQVAHQGFAEVTERYRAALQTRPALCEPFVVLKPYRYEQNGVFKAFDAEGHPLVLDRSERRGSVLAFYDLLEEGLEPEWLAGRLTDRGATLCLSPFSFGTRDGRFIRL